MLEFFTDSLLWINLPWTILLVVAALYWLGVAIGWVDIRGLDVDVADEIGLNPTAEEVAADSPAILRLPSFLRGPAVSYLRFVHFGESPLVFIFTIFVGAGWLFSQIGNFFLSMDENLVAGLGWGFLSFLVASATVHISVKPIAGFFRHRTYEHRDIREALGKRCFVRSLECTPRAGQVEIRKPGTAAQLVEARTTEGLVLRQGDGAYIIGHSAEAGAFLLSTTVPAKESLHAAAEDIKARARAGRRGLAI